MRILLLAQFFPPIIGGEERHVANLARELAARGHEVHVGTLDIGAEPEAPDGVVVHRLAHVGSRLPGLYPTADRPLALPVPDPLTTRGLTALLREVRPDVVHAHNWIVNSWFAVPGSGRLPLVLSLHDYGHVCPTKRLVRDGALCPGPAPRACLSCAGDHYGTPLRGAVMQAAVRGGRPLRERRVDLFAPVSRFVARANGFAEGDVRSEVVPNFVPDALLDRALTTPRDPALPAGPYLFFAGDLSHQKGVDVLLAAWRLLPAEGRPDLVLVGRPEADLGEVPPGVHVHHRWPHDRVVSGFVHAEAAVLPSTWPDPCPTTVLEALALGAPVVTTDRGGIADMVADGHSGLVTAAGDPASLADALTRVLTEPGLGQRLAAGGRDAVRPYLASSVAAQLEGIYTRLAR
ncbi:glycosyltransferase family 4 protein [Nocardioides fonticola]|uniref:Glycosyltransferase family 4 protein n=1 Tax=Nocardioides fonticola TaxID=450363 RepID=A0ABP7XLU5_9ACTN